MIPLTKESPGKFSVKIGQVWKHTLHQETCDFQELGCGPPGHRGPGAPSLSFGGTTYAFPGHLLIDHSQGQRGAF